MLSCRRDDVRPSVDTDYSSATRLFALQYAGTFSVLDLAGGTGFPAIPLATALPQARITLTGAPCGAEQPTRM